jgi:hypothetical protein
LEPGLRRPDGALQRNTFGIPQIRRGTFGISVDGVCCHEAFAKDRHLHFPLLADFEPKGAVAKSYGAYRPEDGVCERALFVIDKNGVISVELRFSSGGQPGRRRNSRSTGEPRAIGWCAVLAEQLGLSPEKL